MEKSPTVLLCGDESFTEGPYFEEVRLKSKRVLSATSLAELNPNVEVDIVLTDLSIPGDASMVLEKVKQGLGPRILIVASDKSPQKFNSIKLDSEKFGDVIFCNTIDRIGDVLSEASNKVHEFFRNSTIMKTQYSFTAKDFTEKYRNLEMLNALEDLGVISNSDRKKVLMVFQEAVTNAVEHGCLELSSAWKDEVYSDGKDRFSLEKEKRCADSTYGLRKVHIIAEFKNSAIKIEVLDEGNGYATEHMIDSALDSPYGRGLSIMMSFMDEVMFFDQGRRIQLRKVIHGA